MGCIDGKTRNKHLILTIFARCWCISCRYISGIMLSNFAFLTADSMLCILVLTWNTFDTRWKTWFVLIFSNVTLFTFQICCARAHSTSNAVDTFRTASLFSSRTCWTTLNSLWLWLCCKHDKVVFQISWTWQAVCFVVMVHPFGFIIGLVRVILACLAFDAINSCLVLILWQRKKWKRRTHIKDEGTNWVFFVSTVFKATGNQNVYVKILPCWMHIYRMVSSYHRPQIHNPMDTFCN